MRLQSLMGAFCLAAVVPTAAMASGDLGSSSTGEVGITIRIPPVAAALMASNEGAVGFWTVSDASNALMVKLPSTVEGGGDGVALFHSPDMLLTASVQPNPFIGLSRDAVQQMNGMERQSFRLTRLSSGAPRPAAAPIVTMMIAGI